MFFLLETLDFNLFTIMYIFLEQNTDFCTKIDQITLPITASENKKIFT